MTDYHECLKLIGDHVKQFSPAELEEMNAQKRQAGVTFLKYEAFKKTEYGHGVLNESPWTIEALVYTTPPVPFPDIQSPGGKPQPLAGIRVLELCRIIAGPALGRTLNEHGADVIKVTAPHLSDVPFFQVDGATDEHTPGSHPIPTSEPLHSSRNMGKPTLDLTLHNPSDRQTFDSTTNLLLDGYRPSALARLRYGPAHLTALAQSRNKDTVYISDSYISTPLPSRRPNKSHRPGRHQIADCITGLALVGYDLFQLALGLYPAPVQDAPRAEFAAAGFAGSRHCDCVDEVGTRALGGDEEG